MKNRFDIVDGHVRTRSLEAHIVDHCNLRCAACCSLSPHLPRWHVEPADLERDLALAVPAIAPTWLKLVGGEPLLHPRLIECLEVARASKIAEIVSVTTNGFLLPRQPEEFWRLVDALTISLYPVPALPAATIALAEERAAEHGVKLNWKQQDDFVQMDRAVRCDDEAENEPVWEACWLRRRCHMIRDGVFYACTRPAHFQTLLGRDFTVDGVRLYKGPGLAEEIRDYLQRPEPLLACALCLGGDAPSAPHRPLHKGEKSVLATP
jgi:cyclic pyranopterin phosphate synthase